MSVPVNYMRFIGLWNNLYFLYLKIYSAWLQSKVLLATEKKNDPMNPYMKFGQDQIHRQSDGEAL
jgi:hypothetical protein